MINDDLTLKALAASLNFRQLRQEVIAANVANSETPNYKSKVVDFEAALQRAIDVDGIETLKVENPNHYNVGNGDFSQLAPEIYDDPNGVASEDGNTVERDMEMSKMAENKILYDASVQMMNKKLGLVKYVIGESR